MGDEISLSRYVVACVEMLRERGLKTYLHALGTNVEGDITEVLSAIECCHKLVHQMGGRRVITSVKLTTRVDRDQTLEEKIHSVESKLNAR